MHMVSLGQWPCPPPSVLHGALSKAVPNTPSNFCRDAFFSMRREANTSFLIGGEYSRIPLEKNLQDLVTWAEAEADPIRQTFFVLVLGCCGVCGSRKLPPAQRGQLFKLRGNRNADVRRRIAGYLGVRSVSGFEFRSDVELERLRHAAAIWRAEVVLTLARERWLR